MSLCLSRHGTRGSSKGGTACSVRAKPHAHVASELEASPAGLLDLPGKYVERRIHGSQESTSHGTNKRSPQRSGSPPQARIQLRGWEEEGGTKKKKRGRGRNPTKGLFRELLFSPISFASEPKATPLPRKV